MLEEYYDKPGILLADLVEEDPDFDLQELTLMNNTLKQLTKQIVDAQSQTSNSNISYDFIGAHPISLSRMQYSDILRNREDWFVCEKTDGVRYIMIVLSNGHVFMTGRNVGGLQQAVKEYQFFRINMSLPSVIYSQGEKLRVEAIFDGEIIVDEFIDYNSNKVQLMHYLIFDTILHNGEQKIFININGSNMPFSYYDRLRCGEEFIDLLRTAKLLNPQKLQDDLPQLKFFPQIQPILKDFFQINQLKYLINHYLNTLPHKNDGLIFTQNKAFYKPGTCKFIQKWKPPHKNSIDFLITPNTNIDLSNEKDGILELYLMEKIKDEFYLMFFDFVYTSREKVKEIEQKIAELYDLQQNNVHAIKGIVAECCMSKLDSQQESFKKLMQPQTFGIPPEQPELFFIEVLKLTQHFIKSSFKIDEFKKDQIKLMGQVREMIHLKDNFKSTWVVEKYRSDKTFPNHFRVGLNILEILSEVKFQLHPYNQNLTQQNLIELAQKN